MTIRSIYDETTSPPPDGTELLAQHGVLWNIALNEIALTLTNVSGADTITADVEPEMPATGWAKGMSFKLTAVADNPGAATLNVNGAGDKALVRADNSALAAGDIVGGTTYLLFYDGTNVRILGTTSSGAESSTAPVEITYTQSGTFINNYPPDSQIYVRLHGAGGGSNNANGGGGGEFKDNWYRAGDLPASITVTVGDGGPGVSGGFDATDGGDTSFGDLLTAHGGEGAGGGGGLGGKTFSNEVGPDVGGNGGTLGAGDNGLPSVNGGGGGAANGGNGGQSIKGGPGGDSQSPGEEPGGGAGGGDNGRTGAKGRAVIVVFPG
jgi:hypothetical protein